MSIGLFVPSASLHGMMNDASHFTLREQVGTEPPHLPRFLRKDGRHLQKGLRHWHQDQSQSSEWLQTYLNVVVSSLSPGDHVEGKTELEDRVVGAVTLFASLRGWNNASHFTSRQQKRDRLVCDTDFITSRIKGPSGGETEVA